MIYEEHLKRADESSSPLAHVEWDHIDRRVALGQVSILARLRDAAIIESYHPVHIPRLLSLLWDDLDATAVLSIEMFEGLRHFHGLKRYLDIVGYEPCITEEELIRARRRALEQPRVPTTAIGALVNFIGSEHFAAYFFAGLSREAAEPVLRRLLIEFARDEFRHAEAVGDVLRRRTREGTAVATQVLEAAEQFTHYGADVVETVPTAETPAFQAVLAFSRRLAGICGSSMVDHLASSSLNRVGGMPSAIRQSGQRA